MSTVPLSRTAPAVIGGLWISFFLWGMAPGYYTPAIPNILAAKGLGSEWLSYAFLAGPFAAMVSPLIIGALADNRFAAQKVVGCISIVSSCFLASAFAVLDRGGAPSVFIGLLACSSIMGAPMASMLASISMVHLKSGEQEFPIIRLGGTLGWMAAGFITSFVLFADASPRAGYAAAVTRCTCGIFCFFLPHTPPLGRSRSLRTLLGLDAFKLLKERDHLVFFSVTALLSIPLAAFFMHTPIHLAALGNEKPTATMTIGQISEIFEADDPHRPVGCCAQAGGAARSSATRASGACRGRPVARRCPSQSSLVADPAERTVLKSYDPARILDFPLP